MSRTMTASKTACVCALTLAVSIIAMPSWAQGGTAQTGKAGLHTQAKKRAAASLLGAPMQAKYDDSTPRKASSDGVPAVAPSFVSTRSSRARELLKEGSRHHSSGNLQEAERCFREAVVLDPRNADCFYNLGALAEGRGDYVDALTQYRAGLNVLPKDSALEEAVEAMEARLANGDSAQMAQRKPNFSYPPRMFTATPQDAPVLGVRQFDSAVLEPTEDSPPLLPVDSSGPFQLHSSQNSALGSTGYGALNSNVSTGSLRPPVVGVQQPSLRRRATGAAFSTILNVGLSTALRGSGLHCPACRFLRF